MSRFAVFFVVVFAFSAAAFAAEPGMEEGYVQQYEMQDGGGQIDWENGYIKATGVGMPPPGASSQAQARALAVRAATVTARRNLLEIMGGVQIDSDTTIKNNMVASDTVMSLISGELHNSRILDTAYMSDGSVVVTVGLSQRGKIADAVLPKGPEFMAGSAPREELPEGVVLEGPYTGLVLDARGLGARPALSPEIVGPDGKTVYGRKYVSRDYAVSQGMAGYAAGLASAFQNPRVGGNPLVLEATGVTGKARTDYLVDQETADKIQALAAKTDVLEQCRVMIVLDGGESKE